MLLTSKKSPKNFTFQTSEYKWKDKMAGLCAKWTRSL